MATRLADVLRFLPLRLKIEGSAKQTIDVARHRLFVGGSLFALAFLVVVPPRSRSRTGQQDGEHEQ